MKITRVEYSDAPPEWEKIPEITANKPFLKVTEVVLKRLEGTNVCAWFVRSGLVWARRSDLFLVQEGE